VESSFGTSNTIENLQNFFLLSWLKIMCGERVGIQLLLHNTNQIKTRKESSPKPANAAEVGALECYIKAAKLMSAS
jgi:hypothetical protein